MSRQRIRDSLLLDRIRELAEEGQKGACNSTMYRNELGEQFEAILHNLNQMGETMDIDTMDTDTNDDAQLDYEAPREHNADFANVTRWQLQYICRCGQGSSISTEARYIRQTCRTCGTVWEIAPTLTDSTPYIAKKSDSEAESTTSNDDAQWWIVIFDTTHGWRIVEAARDATACVNSIRYQSGDSSFYATVHCPRAKAEQAAVDGWRDAGFAHAPQEPPKPKQVKRTVWAIVPPGKPPEFFLGHHQSHMSAKNWCPKGWRIVKVEATISEVDE